MHKTGSTPKAFGAGGPTNNESPVMQMHSGLFNFRAMFYVYIIFSKKLDRYYIGQAIDPEERLVEHNEGKYENAFTCKANDWVMFHTVCCKSRSQAIKIESHLKKMKNRKYYINLTLYPEISEKLLERYRHA